MIKNRLKPLLLFTILLCFMQSNLLFSQFYDTSTTPVDNNDYSATLPKKLLIDNQGFLWYSTFNGIVKEMGSHSVFFKYNDLEGANLDVYTTHQLLKTQSNKIIACTEKGVSIIDIATGKTNWITAKFPDTNGTVSFVSAMEDTKGNVWLGTMKNYLYCYTNDKQLTYAKINESDQHLTNKNTSSNIMTIEAIQEDGSVIIEQSGEWYIVNGDTNKYLFNSESLFPEAKRQRMVSIPNGSVLEKDSSGIIEFENEVYYYKYVPEIDKQIVQCTERQMVYVPGIYHTNLVKPIDFIFYGNDKIQLHSLIKEEEDKYVIKEIDRFMFNKTINDVILDPRGYILAQSQKGITKIQYNNLGFDIYLRDYRSYGLNINISCRTLVQDSKGTIYVYTYSGLFQKKPDDSEFKKVNLPIDQKTQNTLAFSYNIYLLDDNHLLFFGYYGYLIKLNLKTGASEKIEMPKSSVRKTFVIYDAETMGDDLLLSTSIGIYRYNKEANQITEANVANEALSTFGKNVFDLIKTKDGNTLWIATSGSGLFKKDLVSNTLENYTIDSPELELVSNDVKIVYEDQDANIWIGTTDGLQVINPIGNKIQSFTSLNGILNDNIAGIQEDDNTMWISTYEGLIKLDKKTYAIQSYFLEDGLPDNEFNLKSEFKDNAGTIYFGGINGLIKFDPKNITQKEKAYQLFLSQYEKYDEDLEYNKLYLNVLGKHPEFTIPYYQNYLSLTFAINDITHPEKTKYQYKIQQLDNSWVDLGNYNTVQLRGLQPNKYTVEVRGFSSNGHPTNSLTYSVKVQQVFYKQLWFIVLCVLTVFGFILWFNYYRRKKIKKEYLQKNKIQQLESKALRAQMNPHFIFNSLNGMQSVMLLKGEREANKYFTAFSKLIRLTLDMSDSEYICIKDEIKYIESYLDLEKMRLDNRLTVNLEVDPDFDLVNESIPCMLFQPVIENALIHGLTPKKEGDLKLDIVFKKEDNMLLAEVTDNGIGREAAEKMKERSRKEHKSWATHIMNERISISNSLTDKKIIFKIIDLKNKSQSAGTKVVMKIPIKNTIELKLM